MVETKKMSARSHPRRQTRLSGRQGGKKEIHTDNAPEAVGPYSQAVLAGRTLYLSGQIALDPKTGELKNDNIKTETNQVLANLSAVLEAGSATIDDVVKVDIFITDIKDFGTVNTIYEQWLGKAQIKPACPAGKPACRTGGPARQTVEVSALPKGARVEISCVACVNQ